MARSQKKMKKRETVQEVVDQDALDMRRYIGEIENRDNTEEVK